MADSHVSIIDANLIAASNELQEALQIQALVVKEAYQLDNSGPRTIFAILRYRDIEHSLTAVRGVLFSKLPESI